MASTEHSFARLIVFSFLLYIVKPSTSLETIGPGQSIRDGDTIVSTGQSYELGFFSAGGGSARRYLGIWYKRVSTGTVVWVANRETPLFDRSGVLSITDQGDLLLINSTNNVLWSSNGATQARNPFAQLLETGNLVVKDRNDNNSETVVWQSFDYPSDTFLPEMRVGKDFVTGKETHISSWKNFDDPAIGDYTYGIDPRGFPQLVVKNGNTTRFRLGSFNGIRYTGTPRMNQNQVYGYEFVLNDREVYYTVHLRNTSVPTRLVVSASAAAQRLVWIDKTQSWAVYFSAYEDKCDNYGLCGVYATCNINNSPMCACLEGFKPRSVSDWALLDWSGGCVRSIPLDCGRGEGFVKHEGVKLPDTSHSWFNQSMTLKECQELCLKNCSCVGYANSDVRNGGSGCLLWFGDLIDIRQFTTAGQDIYIRVAAAYLDELKKKEKSRERKRVAIIVCSIISVVVASILVWILYIRKWRFSNRAKIVNTIEKLDHKKSRTEETKEDLELPMFDLTTIVSATDNFSSGNKLGEGGFGPVYKGILSDGQKLQEIAVKRLSNNSGQGLEEFKNEVALVSKLQHRNLVKMHGCCIEGDERMLIYEYMPKMSLDYIIFDQSKSRNLNSKARLNIIDGIARGLLYLHRDSRLPVVHRDLKASNVLLDSDMNPRISDFGIAQIFGGNQTEANTTRVVGTYGYMAPEYAGEGLYSPKSDIFSFGVLVLEIISGKRNRGFYSPSHRYNLLGHAWKLWMEDRIVELIDNALEYETCDLSEIKRRIHIGLLCVQERHEDRPHMAAVDKMLSGDNSLPQPTQPGFFTERGIPEVDYYYSPNHQEFASTNELTISIVDPR
ncbi:hypothetical protein Tsubulata_013989 [Turnera subulata]|uniref:Receptor-like serine/threonine-protein kinase n=1 Tax=Turnera subulata TaxID=218843 RepID=A0A9Q0J0G5_9ROSI|nr:hypothetical protein Tsubulata_013989 [Turnera subulata]